VTIVLDTNVLFAALTAAEGFCARLFELCISRHSIVASEHIFTELRRHLTAKSRLSAVQIEASISAIRGAVVKIVIPAPIPPHACRDPDDLPILGTAIAASA
jgi:putative PIN family toxin of toxin-antitoxin system